MKKAGIPILLLLLAACAAAQVQVGDNVSMNLNGILQGGYTGDYTNLQGSDHGFTYGGNADLGGSYYSPGFLSFHLQPFFNQSRLNSAFQSISSSSGLNSSAALFSGSNTPGQISFSKIYNGSGIFAVPGGGDLTTHGNSQNLTIGWGVRIPDRPQLSFNFSDSSTNNSLYGSDAKSNVHSDVFSANIAHTVEGFNLKAGYQFTKTKAELPQYLTFQPESSSSHDNSVFVGASHKLPFNGSISAGASRSDASGEFSSGRYNANIDTVSAGLGFNPITNLNLGSNYEYNNNLAGTLFQSILGAGGIPPAELRISSHSLDLNNYISYLISPIHVTLMGTVDHREQSLFGTSLSANSYNATAIYSNALLGGFVTLVGGVNENTLDVNNSHSLGYLGSIGYSRKVQRWEFTESVNYARNQQTFLINYMSTSYGFNSSVGRRIGQYAHFSLGAGGSKSRLNSITGSDSTTQNYTVALSVKYIGVNAGYSKSSGDAILTAGGLVPTPVPLPVVNPANIIVYGGKAYSFGIGANPMRHMTISASYAKSLNDTASQFLNSNNHMDMFTTRMEYHFRMINFDSGYSRLRQGFSLSGTPPIMIGSFYVGISRWIDFF